MSYTLIGLKSNLEIIKKKLLKKYYSYKVESKIEFIYFNKLLKDGELKS